MRRPQATIAPLPRRRSLAFPGRLWIVALAAVAVLLIGLIARDTFLRPAAQTAGLRLGTVSRGTVRAAVSSTGTLVSMSQLNINFRQPGQLSEVDVKVGDLVKTGQVLARLDSSSQQAALATARASLASAQANLQAAQNPLTAQQLAQLQHALTAAQQNYNDTVTSVNAQNSADLTTVANDQSQLAYDKSVFDADGCSAPTPANQTKCNADQASINRDQSQLSADQSRQRMDAISGASRINQSAAQVTAAQDNLAVQSQIKPNSVAAAQSQVQSAQAQVQSAQTSLDQTTLTAPTDGVVVSINGLPGENVGAGASTTLQAPGAGAPQPAASASGSGASSSAFMVISDPNNFLAVVPFAESDTARLKAEQAASLTFDAVSGLTISGHLLALSPNASVVSNVVNYYASIVLNHSDQRLRAGMTTNVSVGVAEVADALYVPNSAVRRQSGTPMVMVLSNGRQVPTEVEVGLTGDTTTEIKAGLNEGQRVVLPSVRLPSGQGGQRGGFLGGPGGIRGGP